MTPARCAICGQNVGRDKYGRMVMHTRSVLGDDIGTKVRAIVCEGSDRGARP